MRHIDAFCHFFPQGLFEKMSQTAGGTQDIGKRMQGVRTIHDLDARLKMMDEFDDYSEILSLGLPPLDALAGPNLAPDLARVANDGLAELCAKYPDRFAGYVGALPMNAPDAAAKEAERITRFANLLGRENVLAGTDCGFAQGTFYRRVHPTVMWAKFEALVEGARLASKQLWN